MISAAEAQYEELSKNGLSFVFQKWQERWTKCTALEEGYFEMEHSHLDE